MRFSDGALIAGSPTQWSPSHTVIISKDGELLALADCIITPDGRVGNYSILAKEKCGSYAIKAVLCLKRLFPVDHVETTFANPTDNLLTLTRRWADTIYDQETWANARDLTSLYNTGSMLAPVPIGVTMSNLKRFDLPDIRTLDNISKLQILHSCLVNRFQIVSSISGAIIPRNLAIALSFEILKLPLKKRQILTRFFLIESAREIGISIIGGSQGNKLYLRSRDYYMNELKHFVGVDIPPQLGPVFQLGPKNV
jgi:hypothetical protein